MKNFFLLFFVPALAFSSIATAQQDTLINRYRRMSVEYQQQVKMAQRNLSGAESMAEAAKAGYLPKIDFNTKYDFFAEPLQLAPPYDGSSTIGEETHNFYSLKGIVSQPVYTGGYLKNTKLAAQAQVDVMKNIINLSKQEVMMQADIYYWNAVSKKEINRLLISYRDVISGFVKVIQDRVDEKVVGMNELYQAKVRFNDAQYKVIKSEKDYKISIMDLNRLVGLSVYNKTEIADSLIAIKWNVANDSLTKTALEQRPEIGIYESQVMVNEYKEKITSSKYMPKLNLQVAGKWGSPSPGLQLEPGFNMLVKANLNIPVFYWGMKHKEVFVSKQNTEVAKLQLEETKDKITLEVQSSYFALQRTQEQLDFAKSSLDNAKKNADVMFDRYNEGLASVLEVLDAQLYWQKAYFNYVQAKYQLNVAYSSYQKAIGSLVISK
jgi:outer membrane protein TolC